MKSWFPLNRQHLLATLGVVLFVLLGGGILVFLPRTDARPEEFLPASNTVALFSNVSAAQRQKFAMFFPLLSALPNENFPAIAVLKDDSGGTGLAVFTNVASGSEQGDLRLGHFTVHTSSPAIATMLRSFEENSSGASLSKSKPFAQFAEHVGGTSWIFMEAKLLPYTANMSDQVAKALLAESSHIAFAFPTADTVSILFENSMNDGSAVYGALRTPFESPIFALRTSLPAVAPLDGAKARNFALPEETKDIIIAFLAQHAQTLLGSEVSLTYDLLPLLEKESTIAIQGTGNDLRFTLEGSHADEASLQESLWKFQMLARAKLPQSTVDQHVFEDRFRMNLLRQSDEAIAEEQETVGSWSVTTIQAKEAGRGFLTAQRGRRFLVSNDTAAAEAFIETGSGFAIDVPASPIGERAWRVADGIFPLTWIAKSPVELAVGAISTPPSLMNTLLSLLPSSLGSIRWSVETDGRVMSVTMQ